MVLSSFSELQQKERENEGESILCKQNSNDLLLRAECFPILIGIQKHLHSRDPFRSVSLRIELFLRRSKKCPEIELYWSQAVKLLSAAKLSISRPTASFEAAKAAEHFWIIHSELLSLGCSQPHSELRVINIFNERSYLSIVKSVVPIVISCLTLTDMSLVLIPLISSTLAAEHISNLAVNLPSLCVVICAALQVRLRDSTEPAELWRCSRVLLSIASKDKQLAVVVRHSLVREKEHPLLCLEITNRFIHDSDCFLNRQLCPRTSTSSTSVSSSWMVRSLRNADLLAISRLSAERLKIMVAERIESLGRERNSGLSVGVEGAEGVEPVESLEQQWQQWQGVIMRGARIIAVCSTIHSTNTTNCPPSSSSSFSSSDAYAKIDVLEITTRALMVAAEGILKTLGELESGRDTFTEKLEEHVEFIVRVAVILLVIGLTVSTSAYSHVRADNAQNTAHRAQLADRENRLGAVMTSAMAAQKLLADRTGRVGREFVEHSESSSESPRSCSAVESARSSLLFLRLLVTFECPSALRSLCADLSLTQCLDFMPESDLNRVLALLQRMMPRQGWERDNDNALRREFGALRQPSIISSARERTGDWTSCLCLMLSCGLMAGYGTERTAERTDKADIASASSADSNGKRQTEAVSDTNKSGEIHSLMVKVLSSSRWPPHTRLKTCVDEWLVRCIGVGKTGCLGAGTSVSASGGAGGVGGGADRGSGGTRLGLPLLFNEVCVLSEAQLSQPLAHSPTISKTTSTGSATSSSSGMCGFCRKRMRRTKGKESESKDEGEDVSESIFTVLSDSARHHLLLWGGLGCNSGENDELEGYDDDSQSDIHCFCVTSSSSLPSSSSSTSSQSARPLGEVSSCEDAGMPGVIACYATLHYASLSMSTDDTAGTAVSELIYMGPFVCDLRSLPLKPSIQFLLCKLRVLCTSHSSPSSPTSLSSSPTATSSTSSCSKVPSIIVHTTALLNGLIQLATDLCADSLLPDRSRCYRPINTPSIPPSTSSASSFPPSSSSSSSSIARSRVELPSSGEENGIVEEEGEGGEKKSDDLFDAVLALLSSQGAPSPFQCIACCALLSSSLLSTVTSNTHKAYKTECTMISPTVQPSDIVKLLILKAHENKGDRQISAGLWAVWRAVHVRHPYPQQLEIATLNSLLSGRTPDFYPKVFSSYEMLLQEPLQLFSLPHAVLSELFTLQLVLFTTRSALCASRCAVRLALRAKHRVAESFLAAGLRHRSVTESSLYLHEQTYIDLQEVIAVRLVLSLWETWAEEGISESRSDSSCGNSEMRLVVNDFLVALVSDSPPLIGLLLCHKLTPRSFELLVSADPLVCTALSSCHLRELLSVTAALTTLPTTASLSIDPSITSSSVLFATTATQAANLSVASEISPEDVERLLLHSLCVLKLTRTISAAGTGTGLLAGDKHTSPIEGAKEVKEGPEGAKTDKSLIDQLAEALPAFLSSAMNSLNANLSSKDMSPILQHCAAIVNELFAHYPSCAASFVEMIKHPEKRVATANTAAIALAVKGLTGRGHVITKDEEAVMIRARPAVVALFRIIINVEKQGRSHNEWSVSEESQQQVHSASTVHAAVAPQAVTAAATTLLATIYGKMSRPLDDSDATEDNAARKKLKTSALSPE